MNTSIDTANISIFTAFVSTPGFVYRLVVRGVYEVFL